MAWGARKAREGYTIDTCKPVQGANPSPTVAVGNCKPHDDTAKHMTHNTHCAAAALEAAHCKRSKPVGFVGFNFMIAGLGLALT